MFCPSCGSEQQQPSQFCRACGTDLRPVRLGLERPDSITASAVSAREEIGRAVAEKIREATSSRDLEHIAGDVLPQLEKFLESPAEKRLRRMRVGMMIGSAGLGLAFLGVVMSALEKAAVPVIGAGLLVLSIGLGFVVNGLLFTLSRRGITNHTPEAKGQRGLEAPGAVPALRQSSAGLRVSTNELTAETSGASVTENTTRFLEEDR